MPDVRWKIEVPGAGTEVEVTGISERKAMVFGIASMVCITAVVITVLVLLFG